MNAQQWAWIALYAFVGLGLLAAALMLVGAVINVFEAERTMRGRWHR